MRLSETEIHLVTVLLEAQLFKPQIIVAAVPVGHHRAYARLATFFNRTNNLSPFMCEQHNDPFQQNQSWEHSS
jgi:hypothetical protein